MTQFLSFPATDDVNDCGVILVRATDIAYFKYSDADNSILLYTTSGNMISFSKEYYSLTKLKKILRDCTQIDSVILWDYLFFPPAVEAVEYSESQGIFSVLIGRTGVQIYLNTVQINRSDAVQAIAEFCECSTL